MGLVSARKRGKFWQYRFEAASVKSVQARLGHQNVTTTLQTYENLCKSGKVKRQSRCAPYMEIALDIGAFRGQTVRNCRSFCGYAVLYFTRLYCLKVAKPWTAPTPLL